MSERPQSELDQPIWAVVLPIGVHASGLPYAEAVAERFQTTDGVITTEAAAARTTHGTNGRRWIFRDGHYEREEPETV